ncbi:hypothetical protein ACL0VS_10760 [Chryseobacterium sp. PMSZPI]|uniref:hypothetical protein n=1 Tax=Chryseobacterium sp. PMSZPI TaxID=1033900 RepID=UPI0039A2628A
MKRSVLKLIAFSVLPLLVISYAVYITGKKTDDFYKRFISPQQNSLILGSSRAASMNPEIINRIIHPIYSGANLYNYAFTTVHSPYGPKYLESIKKKVKPDTKNGVFIVTVEPTAVMVDKNKPDSSEYYVENDRSVAQTSQVAINPNIEYLLESYNFSITNELNKKILRPKNAIAEISVLDNGKVNCVILKRNSFQKQQEINRKKMIDFEKRLLSLKHSDNRIQYLEKTIDFLKSHGTVIMVRVPINKIPYFLENKSWPDFDSRMKDTALKTNVQYINYNNLPNHYQWTDEVHMELDSMDDFSAVLARDIIKK